MLGARLSDRVKVRRPRARPAGAGLSVCGVRRTTSWLRLLRGLAFTRSNFGNLNVADRNLVSSHFTAG